MCIRDRAELQLRETASELRGFLASLDAEVSIAATGPDRTQVTVTSSRGSPTRALQRLYDLVQTAAGLDKPPS